MRISAVCSAPIWARNTAIGAIEERRGHERPRDGGEQAAERWSQRHAGITSWTI